MTLATIETLVKHWVTFVKGHERLALAIIVAFTVLHLGSKGLDIYDKHLHNAADANQAQIATLEAKIAQGDKEITELKNTVATNAALADAKIAAAKKTVIVQQKIDAALPLPQLSEHWVNLINAQPNSITPQPNGTVAVSTDAAHSTVNELELIPELETEITATQDKLVGCNSVVLAQTTQITDLKSDVELEKSGRKEDAKAAAANRKKTAVKFFKIGFVTGAVAVAAAVTVLHIW